MGIFTWLFGSSPEEELQKNRRLSQTGFGQYYTGRARIQYRSQSGIWITINEVTNIPMNVTSAMSSAAMMHRGHDIRAVDSNTGQIIDMF